MIVNNKFSPTLIKRAAEILKTIGHPVRLHVLEILKERKKASVSQLLEEIPFPVEQSLLSHHLNRMKDRGVLISEKKGMHVIYELKDRSILKIFSCLEKSKLI